jgi:pyruvate kinase
VGLDYKDLPRDVKAGDSLLLNDGLIVLTVDAVKGEQVHTTVRWAASCPTTRASTSRAAASPRRR